MTFVQAQRRIQDLVMHNFGRGARPVVFMTYQLYMKMEGRREQRQVCKIHVEGMRSFQAETWGECLERLKAGLKGRDRVKEQVTVSRPTAGVTK